MTRGLRVGRGGSQDYLNASALPFGTRFGCVCLVSELVSLILQLADEGGRERQKLENVDLLSGQQ
jgi:hypothetical protein